jgi:transcriptional regulator with XRE-family HTH domain
VPRQVFVQESELGKRIRHYRLSRGLTLQALANRTGLTKGYISRIEKARKAPPVSTIINLAATLNVSIADIFGDTVEPSSINLVKKDQRRIISRSASKFGYAYQSLALGFPGKRMEPYVITLPAVPKVVTFQHRGQEMLFMLEGSMKFIYGEKEFIAEEGDCLYFDSNVLHYGISQGNKEAKCLMVIYVPEGS